MFLGSGIVYKFQYGCYNATYDGKTKRNFKLRMCKHFEILTLTGRRVKSADDSAIKKRLLVRNHSLDFEDFSILATSSNEFKVTLI